MERRREELKKLLIDDDILVRKNSKNNEWYTSLGYVPQKGKNNYEYFSVKPWDLIKNSVKKVKYKCQECGEIKETKFGTIMIRKTLPKLCHSCLGKSKKVNRVGELHHGCQILEYVGVKNGHHLIKVKCHCGNIFTCYEKNLLKKNHTTSCGCVKQNAINNFNKSQGYFIKAEHTEEEILEHISKSRDYDSLDRELRRKFIKNKTKSDLSGREGKLVAHHLTSYNKLKNKLINTERNLVCLLEEEHKLFHKIFKYGYNTIDQYYNFLTLVSRGD